MTRDFGIAVGLSATIFLSACQDQDSCHPGPTANEDINWEYPIEEDNAHVVGITQLPGGDYVFYGSVARGDDRYPWLLKLDREHRSTSVTLDEPSSLFMSVTALGDGTLLAVSAANLHRLDDQLGNLWSVPLPRVTSYASTARSGAGVIHKAEDRSCFLSRYDVSGNLTWQRPDEGMNEVLCLDGGDCALLKWWSSDGNEQPIELVDSGGETVWTKAIALPLCRGCFLKSKTAVVGDQLGILWMDGFESWYTNLGGVVSHGGELLWQSRFESAVHPMRLVGFGDGSALVGGNSCRAENRGTDIWISRLDREGRRLWERWFGGPPDEYLAAIHATSDGCIVVAARADDTSGPAGGSAYRLFGFTDPTGTCSF